MDTALADDGLRPVAIKPINEPNGANGLDTLSILAINFAANHNDGTGLSELVVVGRHLAKGDQKVRL